MEKVYGSAGTAISGLIFFSLAVWNLFFHWPKPRRLDWLILFVFIIILFLVIKPLFSPVFIYGQKGLEARKFIIFGEKIFYEWSRVKSITKKSRGGRLQSLWYVLDMEDGSQIIFSRFYFSKNDLRILSDLVRYARNNNPNLEVDKDVLEDIEKSD